MTAGPLSVDVIIPTWNRADLVLGCLASLAGERAHRCVVVDNGSVDATVARITADFPQVVVIALADNLGFAKAVNRGIAAGNSEIVVVLNNDIEVLPGFLEELVAPFVDGDVISVSGVLLTADGSHVDAAGVVADGGLAGYSHLHGEPLDVLDGRGRSELALGPCGGAAAYRRAPLLAVGGFDDEIFAYSEDLDLALRLRGHPGVSVIAWNARARHLGSATLGVGSQTQLRLAGWARGYVLGRYRMGVQWILLEIAVGAFIVGRTRNLTPLLSRARGFARGRRLPPRLVPPHSASVGLREGLGRRRAAGRPIPSSDTRARS